VPDAEPSRAAGRNTPTLVNVAFNGIGLLGGYLPAESPMFWDLRARGLESQVRHPLANRDEMRGDTYPEADALDVIVGRLSTIAEYRTRFAGVFGGTSSITADNLARAIAAFERSLVAVNAPFDRYLGGDPGAMSAAAVRGMRQFERLGCSNCHKGPMLSDYATHVLGVPDHPTSEETDAGLAGMYAFRTPSLRNVALTAPYMHNGVFATLDDVLAFYNALGSTGGRQSMNPHVSDGQLDPLLGRVLAGAGDDMLAFLEALTDTEFDRTVPYFDMKANVPVTVAVTMSSLPSLFMSTSSSVEPAPERLCTSSGTNSAPPGALGLRTVR
jgi:cytochrome c peroxidase